MEPLLDAKQQIHCLTLLIAPKYVVQSLPDHEQKYEVLRMAFHHLKQGGDSFGILVVELLKEFSPLELCVSRVGLDSLEVIV